MVSESSNQMKLGRYHFYGLWTKKLSSYSTLGFAVSRLTIRSKVSP